MERKGRKKRTRRQKANDSGQGQRTHEDKSHSGIIDTQVSQPTNIFESSSGAVATRAVTATASCSQHSSRPKTRPQKPHGKWHPRSEAWTDSGKGRPPSKKQRESWSDDRNDRYNSGSNTCGGVGSNDNQGNSPGGSGNGKKRRRWRRGQRRNQHLLNSQCESSAGPHADSATAASTSLEIPGFYYDAEKKRYFKIESSSYVAKDDKNSVTYESIRKKQAETQRRKDVAAFEASPRQTYASSSSIETACRRPQHHSLSSKLLYGYQRGEITKSALERAWILSSAPQLRQTGMCPVSQSFSEGVHVEHMLQMEINKAHDQLLCLWSLSGTTVQRLKLVNVDTSQTRSKKLCARFTSLPHVGDVQSWNKITSMCWSDFSQHPGQKFVLYSTMCYAGQVSSLAFIRCLEEVTPTGFDHLSYNLGRRAIWTCAWNYHKQHFGVGTEKGCVVIDARTRLKWQYNTMNSDVLAQVFTKEDGGRLMYTGIRRGSILQHDLRSSGASPVSHWAMNHQSSVCCLRLSPEEHYLYASDFIGGIKKWDLRMRKEVLTYDGLFNLQCKLPFHIDETQSLLYAAGQDCYTKIWCLKTGKLLLTIPPPYEASLYSIPAVCFSTRWGRSPGNMGLIMGAHKHFYMYSVQNSED